MGNTGIDWLVLLCCIDSIEFEIVRRRRIFEDCKDPKDTNALKYVFKNMKTLMHKIAEPLSEVSFPFNDGIRTFMDENLLSNVHTII